MTITEVLATYEAYVAVDLNLKKSTRKNYRMAVNSLVRVIGDVHIEHLGMDHIMRWKLAMRGEANTPATMNTNLAKIRQLLKFCTDNEIRVMEPAKIRSEKLGVKKEQTWLTPDEVRLLASTTKNVRDRAIVELFFATGCRLSELLSIDRGDFEAAEEVKDGVFEVWVLGKGDKYRQVYFGLEVKAVVDEYLATRKDRFKPLFVSRENRRLGPSMVEKMFNDITARSGLQKRVTPHVLRHSYTSDLVNNNAPISAVSNLLGHADPTVTLKVYTHINKKQGLDAYVKSHSH